MGTQVTVVEMADHILPLEDTEAAKEVEKALKKQGVTIHTGTTLNDLKRSGKTVTGVIGEGEKWSGDCCLISIGVIPNTDNIGLEDVGISVDRGIIQADEYLRTNVPS